MRLKWLQLFVLIAVSVLLFGCGRSTKGQGDFFSAMMKPPSQKGIVYVYQIFKNGLGNKPVMMFANDEAAIWLRMGSYYPHEVEPGLITYWARGTNRAEVKVNVQPGGVYFLRVEQGVFGILDVYPIYFKLVDEQKGLEDLKDQRLLLKPLGK